MDTMLPVSDSPQGQGARSSGSCRLSIVVPCYNEQEVIGETVQQLRRLLDELCEGGRIAADSEIVLVDDGSRDRTWTIVRDLHRQDGRVRGIKLSGNRGHQIALLAGLFGAQGDAVVSIDADLQDDIRAIGDMVDALRSGNDVVYGVRRSREVDHWLKRGTAHWYYRILAAFGVRLVFDHADFRLLSRRALEALKQYPEAHVFLRGIVPLMGFPSAIVYYTRAPRFAGSTKYSVGKMLALALDGVTSFTAYPLRLIAFLGIAVSLFSVAMVFWVLWIKLVADRAIPGWASSVIPIYFIGGVQLLSIGVLGEYVAKLYAEAKRRPRYFIEDQV